MDEAARQARWDELRHAIFGDHAVKDGADLVRIEAAERAEDAAIVPVTIALAEPIQKRVRKLYFVINDNPSPMAAVLFGAAAEPRSWPRACASTTTPTCTPWPNSTTARSTPASASSRRRAAARRRRRRTRPRRSTRLGKMKLAFQGVAQLLGAPVTAQLLISHPNSSGAADGSSTRNYYPRRLHPEDRCDLCRRARRHRRFRHRAQRGSEHPLRLPARGKAGELQVEVEDSNQRHFTQHWPLPPATD